MLFALHNDLGEVPTIGVPSKGVTPCRLIDVSLGPPRGAEGSETVPAVSLGLFRVSGAHFSLLVSQLRVLFYRAQPLVTGYTETEPGDEVP